MFKNDLVCTTTKTALRGRGRESFAQRKNKKPLNFVLSPQNDQIYSFGLCVFLSVCFLGYWVLSLKPRRLTRDQLC